MINLAVLRLESGNLEKHFERDALLFTSKKNDKEENH